MNQYYIENEINSECIGLEYIPVPNQARIIQSTQGAEEGASSSSEIIKQVGGVDQQLGLSGPNLQVEYDGPKNDSYRSYDRINHSSQQNLLSIIRNGREELSLVFDKKQVLRVGAGGLQRLQYFSRQPNHSFNVAQQQPLILLLLRTPKTHSRRPPFQLASIPQLQSRDISSYFWDQPDEHFVSATPEIPCMPDHNQQLILNQQNVTFTLHSTNHPAKEVAEVRLYGKNASGQDKLVGCYEFLLNNYVKAYQQLSRNCIQLRVQIAENYVIVYDVFVEHTEEALLRLVQEHETAHRLHIAADDISEIDSFLPHEISNQHLEEIYTDIRTKEGSSAHHQHRYWSPKRQRPSIRLFKDVEENEKAENTHSTIISEHTRTHLLKAHKSISADMSFSLQRLYFEEIASQAQRNIQDRYKTIEELYKVIGSDSKIIQPDELDQHQRQRRLHLKSSAFNGSRHKSEKKTSTLRFTLKYIVIIVLLVTLAAFFVSSFSASNQPYHINRSTKMAKGKH